VVYSYIFFLSFACCKPVATPVGPRFRNVCVFLNGRDQFAFVVLDNSFFF